MLDVALFTLHILVINVLVGGCMLLLYSRIARAGRDATLLEPLGRKLPVAFALGINLGVAPLLFLQVVWGHLFYSSSILLGTFWILVIPLVIVAYYGTYLHAKAVRTALALAGLGVATLILLVAGFVYVNNILLMMQPDRWQAYFGNRDGTLLPLSDSTLIPRYLHYMVSSVAVAALFMSTLWTIRKKRGAEGADDEIRKGLRLFGYATLVQAAVGFWFLVALKRDMLLQFMGGDPIATAILGIGVLGGLGALATAFNGKLRPTLIMAAVTVVAMVITRDQLRTMYLQGSFDPATLQVSPQYGVFALFLVVLVAGLASVVWMLRAGFRADGGRVTS
jgi:hypothetical protein